MCGKLVLHVSVCACIWVIVCTHVATPMTLTPTSVIDVSTVSREVMALLFEEHYELVDMWLDLLTD